MIKTTFHGVLKPAFLLACAVAILLCSPVQADLQDKKQATEIMTIFGAVRKPMDEASPSTYSNETQQEESRLNNLPELIEIEDGQY